MSDFDLRALINEALDTSPSADPTVIARDVISALPADRILSALATVLPHYVTAIAGTRRNHAMSAVPEPTDQMGSRRWSAAASLLSQPVSTPDGWKHLRECTYDDLLAAAASRRTMANGLVQQAEKFEAVADLLLARGATTVADLGEEAVRQAMAA